jgi:hypothetical protein
VQRRKVKMTLEKNPEDEALVYGKPPRVYLF